jgi:TolA-binding protein
LCGCASGCWIADALKPPPEVTEQYDAAKGMFLKQEYARAEVAFKAFISSHPKNPLTPWARYYLAQCYRHQELFNEAIEPFNELVAQPPSQEILPVIRYDLAECYRRTGKTNEAKAQYEQLVADSTKSPSKAADVCGPRADAAR